jgi:hypothetical protein
VIFALPPKSPNLNPVANICQFIRDNWFSNRVFKSFASTKKGNLLPEDEQSVKSWMIIAIADEVCGGNDPRAASAISYDVRTSRLRCAVTNIPRTAAWRRAKKLIRSSFGSRLLSKRSSLRTDAPASAILHCPP